MVKSVQELKDSITPERIEAVKKYLELRAYRETIEPVIRRYEKEILAKHRWQEKRRYHGDKSAVLDPDRVYLLSDSNFKIYLDEVHKKHLENGFDVPHGYCPLLMAEHAENQARWSMIDIFEPVTGINHDCLFKLEHIEQITDILCRMVIGHCSANNIEFK